MKKTLLGFCAIALLSACQTTGSLRPGEVYGTDIGSILASEANLDLSIANEDKMNSEIEKALFFSNNGLTTSWYAGSSARLRPTGNVRDRRDRDCRRFRFGVMMSSQWYNSTAVACREDNIAWYLISNRWDRRPTADRDRRIDRRRDDNNNRGRWENLSDELGGNPANNSNDDFGPRNNAGW
ncbi:exported hypothetical protein [Candidatus Terasakiella magnetica]|uniref:Surface antigen domain-containing protein n=1 Tax=Candidatus Terasakiella magnetica TaxID=1867952 RepID=A0A1C3RHR8_9PROT|nr:membrane lipoprotein lipid attachment site-containing protein [Candidatus Terasakiella magnetica]SCA56817.1 exported hypothetical protein [Candidatus Terasakiella magnetica]